MSQKVEIQFSKYEGAGNDFIAIDMTSQNLSLTSEQLQRMCKRTIGIGADGVLVLQKCSRPGFRFKLMYYNADGQEGSLCGNGSRCSLAFAEEMQLVDFEKPTDHVIAFEAYDGGHTGGKISTGKYYIDMTDVAYENVEKIDEKNYFLDTGSPHHVRFVENVSQADAKAAGKRIRWNMYGQQGANVNFVEISPQNPSHITARTFERGVEDETLSCGTGAVASALAAYLRHQHDDENREAGDSAQSLMTTQVEMTGGILDVAFKANRQKFSDVRLSGPARRVFDGKIVI